MAARKGIESAEALAIRSNAFWLAEIAALRERHQGEIDARDKTIRRLRLALKDAVGAKERRKRDGPTPAQAARAMKAARAGGVQVKVAEAEVARRYQEKPRTIRRRVQEFNDIVRRSVEDGRGRRGVALSPAERLRAQQDLRAAARAMEAEEPE